MTVIAIDAMGGDGGPDMVLSGASLFVSQNPQKVRFSFYGDQTVIRETLEKHPSLAPISTVHHSDHIITSQTAPASAVRYGRQSQLARALQSVVDGEVVAVVSAGNTGAYMALSKSILGIFDGLDRPALPAWIPNPKGRTLVLDVGANLACSPRQLAQFAILGEILVQNQLNIPKPSIGILNIGTEDIKGHTSLQETAQILRDLSDVNLHGFVEGQDMTAGTVDVVVTDGFTGNVALKTIEGTARLMQHFLRHSFEKNLWRRLTALLAMPALRDVRRLADPRLYNGTVFLGLKHVAVKSHGGTDAVGFANAIQVAMQAAQSTMIQKNGSAFGTLTMKLTYVTCDSPDKWLQVDHISSLCETAVKAVFQNQKIDSHWVSILLTNNQHIQELNHTYRGKNKPTNVLSFSMDDEECLGDIVLAFETIQAEVEEAGIDFDAHVTHMALHGTLHLLGYDHEEDDEAEEMETLESEIMISLGHKDPYR